MIKPFAVEELLARIAAIERRGRATGDALVAGALRLDPVTRAARREGREIELTEREAAMLGLLMRNARAVVTRERALDELWSASAVENVVDRTVTNLRRKLGEPTPIRTVRGVGFVLEP